MDTIKTKKYEDMKAAGYDDKEIDSFLRSKGQDPNQYRMSGFLKGANVAAKVAPAVLGTAGGLFGGLFGGPIGAPLGVGAGVGAGEAFKQSMLGLINGASVKKTGTSFGERMTPSAILQSPQIASAMAGPVAGVEAYVGGKILGKIGGAVSKTKLFEILKETVKPVTKGQFPSVTKGMASQATNAASRSKNLFSKPLHWVEYADEIKKLTPEEQVKAIPRFFKELSTQVDTPVKELQAIGFDRIKDAIPSLKFSGGNTVSILEGLGLRRSAAQAAYNKKTVVEKFINMFTGISKPDVIAGARNKAFNSQVQQVIGIKNWDKAISIYKSPLGAMAKSVALYKILRPFFGGNTPSTPQPNQQ